MSDGHTQAEFDRRVAVARSIAFEEMEKWTDEQVGNAQKKLMTFFKGKDQTAMANASFLLEVCSRAGFTGSWSKVLGEEEQARRRMLYVDKFIAARKAGTPAPADPL